MRQNQDHSAAGSRRRAKAGMACAGVCLGLLLGVAQLPGHAGQDSSAITVTPPAAGRGETPFACSLEKTLTKQQRAHKKELARKMESARMDTKELPNGYVFQFRPEGVSFAEVADWVATERVCCPFFDLAIEAERENGRLSLRITGREGVKQFIRTEFTVLKVR